MIFCPDHQVSLVFTAFRKCSCPEGSTVMGLMQKVSPYDGVMMMMMCTGPVSRSCCVCCRVYGDQTQESTHQCLSVSTRAIPPSMCVCSTVPVSARLTHKQHSVLLSANSVASLSWRNGECSFLQCIHLQEEDFIFICHHFSDVKANN